MTSIQESQNDMRQAYCDGAPGAATSASVWLLAAIVGTIASPVAGVWTLAFGEMMIFPASIVLCRVAGRSGRISKENPLAPLALQGTLWMLLSMLIAVGVATIRIEWFFPAMLLIIGGRYLTFVTLYGLRIYWFLGITLALAGALLVVFQAHIIAGAYGGAFIEYAFGVAIFINARAQNAT